MSEERVILAMTTRDAGFCVEHLRYLARREKPTSADHAAANLSATWLADLIESAQRPGVDLERIRAEAWNEGHVGWCEESDVDCARLHPNPYRHV